MTNWLAVWRSGAKLLELSQVCLGEPEIIVRGMLLALILLVGFGGLEFYFLGLMVRLGFVVELV